MIDRIQAALLEHVARDNVVYHGFAGQMLLEGIAHVLKVRVIADPDAASSSCNVASRFRGRKPSG